MDALLTGSIKEDRRAELGVSYGVDMSKLEVCFGGFSPTVMGDMTATWERAVEAEARLAERKRAAILAAKLEAARESEVRTWTDEDGTQWAYVLLDGADVRIKGCTPACASVCVPSSIDGHPVSEISAVGCANLQGVTEITVPDSVIAIGDCAFRSCIDLERITLPALVSEYRPDWFRHCQKLSSLKLPGALEVLTPRVFDHGALRELIIGEGTRDVQPGTFIHSKLTSIQVESANPFMASDGHALYTKDWAVMAALATPQASYAVHEGCQALSKKAFSSFASLECVDLPDSVEVIGAFAFAGTSIASFTAPKCLKAVLEKAFYGCRHLASVTLDEDLESLGESAFADTALSQLHIPATVRAIGAHLIDGTQVRVSGAHPTFTVEEKGSIFFADDAGGLYRKEDDGVRFVRLMDADAVTYEVLPGCTELEKQAFEGARKLKSVRLPEGLMRIGGAAFRGCTALEQVTMPESIRWIGGDAFLDTNIQAVHLSEHLEHLGPRAVVTLGAHHGQMAPSLRCVSVSAGSDRFRMHEGLLLERKDDGAERVIIYVGPDEAVHIPETVDEIAAYAFNGATQTKALFLSDRITAVGPRGLAVDTLLEHIHVDMVEPVEGHGSFDIYPPRTDRSEQQMMLALTVPTFVNVEALFEYYDNSIINASSFDALSEDKLDAYEQAVRLIERLQDPVFMTSVSQDMARRVLHDGLERFCLEMARHDDRVSLQHLADLGILDASNVDAVIEAVQRLQDASVTGYLLEVKRERFGRRSFDFSL